MTEYASKLLKQDKISFQEFQKFAVSTRDYDGGIHGLSVCFMKLPGELNEYRKETDHDKKLLEASDVLWKIANICDYMIIDFNNTLKRIHAVHEPCIYEYLENAGKIVRDGNIKHEERRRIVIGYLVYCLSRVIASGFNLTSIYKANIVKLSRRQEKGTILNR